MKYSNQRLVRNLLFSVNDSPEHSVRSWIVRVHEIVHFFEKM